MAGTQQVDSQTLRDTAGRFTDGQGQVRDVIAAVQSSINALVWTGGIADQFRDDFFRGGGYKGMLETLAGDMESTATALQDKAAEYDLVFHGS